MINVSQLKPAVILVHRCSRRGGVTYSHQKEIFIEKAEDNAQRRESKKWEGERTIHNVEEFQEGQKLQSACKYAVAALGRKTALGILVDESRLSDIDEEIKEWSQKIDKFNAAAKFTRIENFIMKFIVSGDNKKVLEMMLRDLAELLEQLTKAMSAADPKSIREVLQKLKNSTELLPAVAADLVENAVSGAKEKAREIAKAQSALKNAVEDREERLVELEILKKKIDLSPVKAARFAVLLDEKAEEPKDRSAEVMGARMGQRFAALASPLAQA